MSINKRIQSLLPYLTEIKFSETLTLVGGNFYPKWRVNENRNPLVKIHNGGNNEEGRLLYHFYAEKGQVDIDGLLDYFEETINENLDRERKEDLFKKKVDELKGLFKGNTLTDLENLSMNITEDEAEEIPGYTQLDDE
jgi:hypothetical protein|tara:strand:- start:500 stop:913 length:414 start_codon:yes stop_codon:yes gene_type:complete